MALQVASVNGRNPGPANPLDLQGGTPFYNIAAQQAQAAPPQGYYADTSPSYSSGGSSGVSYSSGGAAPAPFRADPGTLAAFDQSIGNTNSAVGRLDGQQNVGFQNIDTNYNGSVNQLNTEKGVNQRDYNTSKTQDSQNFVTNKNTINTNAGNSINSLLRLLGSHGAGGSSAALTNAPEAVGRQQGIQRNQAGSTFGQNEQKLDTNWNDYLARFKSSLDDLGRQRENNRNSLAGSIAQTRAGLLQQLAQLTQQRTAAAGGSGARSVAAAQPFLNQANGLLSQADQLGHNVPIYQTAPAVYTAPQMSDYLVNKFATPEVTGQPGSGDPFPFLTSLLQPKKDLNNLGAQ